MPLAESAGGERVHSLIMTTTPPTQPLTQSTQMMAFPFDKEEVDAGRVQSARDASDPTVPPSSPEKSAGSGSAEQEQRGLKRARDYALDEGFEAHCARFAGAAQAHVAAATAAAAFWVTLAHGAETQSPAADADADFDLNEDYLSGARAVGAAATAVVRDDALVTDKLRALVESGEEGRERVVTALCAMRAAVQRARQSQGAPSVAETLQALEMELVLLLHSAAQQNASQ